jgi:hypothetical protein
MDIMMAYRVFTLPVHNPGAAETELNGFLASHRVLSVDRTRTLRAADPTHDTALAQGDRESR